MTPQSSYIGRMILEVSNLVKLALPLAVGIALFLFLWGFAMFVFKEDKKNEGKNRMLQGVIALFVIVSVWGLVALLGQFLGIYVPVETNHGWDTMPSTPGQALG